MVRSVLTSMCSGLLLGLICFGLGCTSQPEDSQSSLLSASPAGVDIIRPAFATTANDTIARTDRDPQVRCAALHALSRSHLHMSELRQPQAVES